MKREKLIQRTKELGFSFSNRIAKIQREYQRERLAEQNLLPTFGKEGCKTIILVRLDLLRNYMSNFGTMLNSYCLSNKQNFDKIISIIEEKRLKKIINSAINRKVKDYVTIQEIYELYDKLNLKTDFKNYFRSKTQFSYSVFKEHKIRAISNKFAFSKKDPVKVKFAQFIHMILCEYIALNNIMFVSGYKIKEIDSIDKWLSNI